MFDSSAALNGTALAALVTFFFLEAIGLPRGVVEGVRIRERAAPRGPFCPLSQALNLPLCRAQGLGSLADGPALEGRVEDLVDRPDEAEVEVFAQMLGDFLRL